MNRYLNEDKFHQFLEQLIWFQLGFTAVVGGLVSFIFGCSSRKFIMVMFWICWY